MRKYLYLLDIIVILAFVVVGRHTHKHGESFTGIVSTTWPFFVGWVLGVLEVRRRRKNLTSVAAGVIITVFTVVMGMILRVVSGQGTAVPFIIVALCFLGLGLIGWRYAYNKKTAA
jgi:peptidoglycan/LPS O-acetylase OafA/YrhL